MPNRNEMWPPKWRNQPVVLYHGTDEDSAVQILAHGVDVHAGRPEVDFGQGVYTTTSLKQARDWARMKGNRLGKQPAVLRLTIDRLELRQLRSLAFVRAEMDSDDYWSFVAHCRRGRHVSPTTEEDYDVVYGQVAMRWGPDEYEAISGLDQISFHGYRGQELLRDAKHCKIEVIQ